MSGRVLAEELIDRTVAPINRRRPGGSRLFATVAESALSRVGTVFNRQPAPTSAAAWRFCDEIFRPATAAIVVRPPGVVRIATPSPSGPHP